MISLADGTTRFVQTYPGNDPTTRSRVDLLALSGNRSYQRNEKGEFEAAPPGMAAFILGHDAVRRAHAAGSRPGSLSSPAPAEMGGGTVTIEYGDYRRVIGLQLPFAATFVHSAAPGDRFVYRYTELLPFRVAPGSPSPGGAMQAALLFERLGDLAEIGRAHERVMAAHRASDAELLTADAADRSIVSGRGMLSETRRDEQLTRMRGYLGSVRFSRYEDTQAPVIAMSADGTLAWLACEMEAEGVRNADGKSEPLAYAFSDLHPAAQLRRLGVRHIPGHDGQVLLVHAEPRMRQTIGQVAVARQQEESLGVHVQPAHREHAAVLSVEQVEHRSAPLLVLRRHHDSARLVEDEVQRNSGTVDEFTI
jgi:hypothetical protein